MALGGMGCERLHYVEVQQLLLRGRQRGSPAARYGAGPKYSHCQKSACGMCINRRAMPGVAVSKHLPDHHSQLPSHSQTTNSTVALLTQVQGHGLRFFFTHLLYAVIMYQ